VGPSEFFDGAWQGKDRRTKSPHLVKLGDLFNHVSALCAVVILKAEEEERLGVLIKVIKLAEALRKLKNYEGMAAVGTIFHWASIKRLKPLWDSLPNKIIDKKEEIDNLLNPTNSYSYMRKQLTMLNPGEAYIPFLAPRLRDLRYLYDSSNKMNPDGSIDVQFMMKIGSVIYEVIRGKENEYHFTFGNVPSSNDRTVSLLSNPFVVDTDEMEDVFYERSRQIYQKT